MCIWFFPLLEYFLRKIHRMEIIGLMGIFSFICFSCIEMCFVWKVSQQHLRSQGTIVCCKTKAGDPRAWHWLYQAFHWSRDTPGCPWSIKECFSEADRKRESHLKQYRHGIQMTTLEKWSFALLIFFLLPYSMWWKWSSHFSFYLWLIRKSFQLHSVLAVGLVNNRHSTHICWIKLQGTEFL